MATSCCCPRRRQQASPGQAEDGSLRRARITSHSAQDIRKEPEAVHQDHRQESACCGDSSSAAAVERTSERVAAVVRERERSRPLYGRPEVAVMRPEPGRCLLDSRPARDVPARWLPSSLGHSLSRLCDNWLSSCNALVCCLSKQMPSLANGANQSNFYNSNQKHHYRYQARAPFVRTSGLLFTTIYLMLALELTSASLMSAIINGANSVNQHQPGNLKAERIPSESSLEGSSKLARQILASHYQNQILSHIQSQVATTTNHEQHVRSPQQATTNAAWPQYEEYGAHQYGALHHQTQDAMAPSDGLSAWSVSAGGEQQAGPSHPGPPVNQPHQAARSPAALQSAQPTTPTLNKQLAPPPPFYEFGLMPTNVLQLESVPAQHQQHQQQVAQVTGTQGAGRYEHAHNQHQMSNHHHVTSPMASVISGMQDGMHQQQQHNQMMQAAESALAVQLAKLPAHNSSSSSSSTSGANRDSRAMMGPPASETLGKSSDQQDGAGELANTATDGQSGVSSSNSQNSDSKFDNNNHEQQQQQSGLVDKGIEPRQRRRMFNRILKKAEWNHLFLEMSKVFLRYFLDLAWKDIIGKQSGALGSSSTSGTDTTTGRKKLDAQSELADMLKEFVKTALSNLR